MSHFVYADNAATTRVLPAVLDRMMPFLTQEYGNPSSLYGFGQTAHQAVEAARNTVATCLHCRPDEVFFTSGGSEADNWAIKQAARAMLKKGKKHIISSAFEHHAVLHTLKVLEKEGFEVTLLPVYQNGIVRVKDIEESLRPDTGLITVMYANNEIGTVQPVGEIGTLCRERGIWFHTDAVQAVGHLPIDFEQENIDMLSLSGHKFHGPKGIGALIMRKGIRLAPHIDGGAQEKGRRAGTENTAGIVGLAAALEIACQEMQQNNERLQSCRDLIISSLLQAVPRCRLNGDAQQRLPGNVNISFEGIEGESLLLMLDANGICASSGSACTSGSLDPSHVLLSIGLPHAIAHGSLRLSLAEDITDHDVQHIIQTVPQVVSYLRDMSPLWEEIIKNEQSERTV